MNNFNKTKNLNQKQQKQNRQKQNQKQKQTIFWDVDDVLLNSVATCVYLINLKYNIPNYKKIKTIQDIKDWQLKSIYKDLTDDQLEDIFASNEFWENITLKPEVFDIFYLNEDISKNYNHSIITNGGPINLEKKKEFLEKILKSTIEHYNSKYTYIGLPIGTKKSTIDMSGGIQIDDNIEKLLDTNAAIKILLTNEIDTVYNNAYGNYTDQLPDNLYIANNLEEVKELLKFNLQHNLLEI